MAVSVPNHIKKHLVMKPEVKQIFTDLEAYLNHCRFNLLKYDPKDLYKSEQYKAYILEKKQKSKK